MDIGFSCNIEGRGGHNFVRLSLRVGDTVPGEGWETLGLTAAALQEAPANPDALHAAPAPRRRATSAPPKPKHTFSPDTTSCPAARPPSTATASISASTTAWNTTSAKSNAPEATI